MGRHTSHNFKVGEEVVIQPDTFYDFTILGSDIYVGTDRGVCKYPLSTLQVDDCLNVYDGMPNWATRSVANDGTRIYEAQIVA